MSPWLYALGAWLAVGLILAESLIRDEKYDGDARAHYPWVLFLWPFGLIAFAVGFLVGLFRSRPRPRR